MILWENGHMSRKLDDLKEPFRQKVFVFLARLTEADIPVMIIDTLRTRAEQQQNIKKGVSWTMNSKHLVGKAIDICPYSIYQLHGADKMQWNDSDPVWKKIGLIGQSCGLKWAIVNKDGRRYDLGHFEEP
jgi:hypothetical protein